VAEGHSEGSEEDVRAGGRRDDVTPRARRRTSLRTPFLIFLLLSLVLALVGYAVYERQIAAEKAQRGRELATIRDLKAAEIARWYVSQLDVARTMAADPALGPAVRRWVAAGHPLPVPAGIGAIINGYLAGVGGRVVIVDARGSRVYAQPIAGRPVAQREVTSAREAMSRGKVLFTDLFLGPGGKPAMAFTAPAAGGLPAGAVANAAFVLQADPNALLFPLIQRWPTGSPSAETLLVQRRGESVVYLNTLRHRSRTALRLSIPLTDNDLPAVRAVDGRTGVASGIDYRGVPVLAATGKVPGTGWAIVAKIDTSELEAPLRKTALVTIGAVLLSIILAGVVILLLWSRRENAQMGRLYEAERDLRLSEQRFHDVFVHAPVGMALVEPGGAFVSANPALCGMLGFSEDELQGRSYESVIDLSERLAVAAGLARVLDGPEEALDSEQLLVRKDGGFVNAEVAAMLVSGEGTEAGYLVLTVDDVTDRRRAVEALHESEARFRGVFESSLSGFALHEIVLDEEGGPADYIFLELNPAFEEMTGLRRADVLGRRATEVLPGIEDSGLIERYGATALSGRAERFEIHFEPLGRDYDIQTFSPSPGRFATIFVDITARVRADEARRKAEEELAELNSGLEQRVAARTSDLAQANQELEAFSYSVSHDLRAPLRALDGFSLALAEDYGHELDEAAQDYLRRIRAASQRMARLIDDLLQLSRVTRAEMAPEPVDLAEIAADVLGDLRSGDASRKVDVQMPEHLVANGDAKLLEVLLANLLGNAWKFTSGKELAHIELGTEHTDHETVYYVRDDGAGFDPVYADKLFTPFQRLHTSDEFPGTGIGLATVKRIVRRHGGNVWAEGAVGSGTTVRFTLGEGESG
jgi:PAS domain S-box-containing protein